MKGPRPRNPGGTVRRANLERTLEAFNAEVGVKVAQALYDYHEEYGEPRFIQIEKQLNWLALPFYKRWFRKLSVVEQVFVGVGPGEKVVTTIVGAALFEGEEQTGVVVKRTPGRIHVRIDGTGDVQEFSLSVWELQSDRIEDGDKAK